MNRQTKGKKQQTKDFRKYPTRTEPCLRTNRSNLCNWFF